MTLIAAILALSASWLIAAPAAHADGDPASDVLAYQRYFDPIDLNAPTQVARLAATLDAAAQVGFQIRVALIASPADLGTVTSLWNNPRAYRVYLGTELSYLYAGQLLVVMPDGFGLYGPAHGPNRVTAAEWAVRALRPGPGVRLVDAALSAVPLLASAAGHPIPPGLIHVSTPVSAGSSKLPLGAWLALAAGVLLIALSWRASLRARPLRASR